MVRWLTAGESHGPALVSILEGMPAGVPLTTSQIQDALARRRLGHGRGARMTFEQDRVSLVGGVRHGLTLGSPIAVQVENTEWPKWDRVMAADPVDPAELEGLARATALTRPRPGHADLTGMQKYGFAEARPLLERASARETAARVAAATAARSLLSELGVEIVSHTVAFGGVAVPDDAPRPTLDDAERLDADPVRCADPETSALMVAEVDAARKQGETLGGIVEVLAYGVPIGLGSHVHADRRLDARIAGAMMGIQAIKGVEIGDGFATAARRGSAAHDAITRGEDGMPTRVTDRAGGIEAGMSTGQPVRVRAAMKPIATVPRALGTVDVATGAETRAHHQRSDVAAVPAAGVVAESILALVLVDALMEKFGGDSLAETRRNLEAFTRSLPVLPEPDETTAEGEGRHMGDPLP